jgi:hypothetical protein
MLRLESVQLLAQVWDLLALHKVVIADREVSVTKQAHNRGPQDDTIPILARCAYSGQFPLFGQLRFNTRANNNEKHPTSLVVVGIHLPSQNTQALADESVNQQPFNTKHTPSPVATAYCTGALSPAAPLHPAESAALPWALCFFTLRAAALTISSGRSSSHALGYSASSPIVNCPSDHVDSLAAGEKTKNV